MAGLNPAVAFSQMRGLLRRQHDRMQTLYDGAIQAQRDAEEHGQALMRPLTGRAGNIGNVVMGEQALRLDDLHEAAEVRNIYAGTVIDVMDLALSPLVDAAEAAGLNIYADLEPKIHGTPVWKMIRDARNNHHHWQDWGQADPPKGAQKHDIIALCLLIFGDVPNPMPRSPIANDASLDALTHLSNSYDELEHLVRAAAWDIVQRFGLEDDNHVVFAGEENGGLP